MCYPPTTDTNKLDPDTLKNSFAHKPSSLFFRCCTLGRATVVATCPILFHCAAPVVRSNLFAKLGRLKIQDGSACLHASCWCSQLCSLCRLLANKGEGMLFVIVSWPFHHRFRKLSGVSESTCDVILCVHARMRSFRGTGTSFLR